MLSGRASERCGVSPAGWRRPWQVYAFGTYLFRLGGYYRAVTELKRFTLLFPRHRQHDAAQVLIGLALQGDAAHGDARAHFQRLSQFNGEISGAQVASSSLASSPSQGQYQLSARNWQRFLNDAPQSPLTRRTAYLLDPSRHKSPTAAGVLSGVLPGAGRLYIGKPPFSL